MGEARGVRLEDEGVRGETGESVGAIEGKPRETQGLANGNALEDWE